MNRQSHERSVGKLSNQVEHCFDDQLGCSDDRQMVAVQLDNGPAQRLRLPGRRPPRRTFVGSGAEAILERLAGQL